MKAKYLIAFITIICSFISDLSARNPHSSGSKPKISYKTEAGNCNVPVSQVNLEINNVRAVLLDGGDLWSNLATASAGYEVPKSPAGSTTNYPQAIYMGAIWVSGLDAGNNLKIAAEMYRSNGGVDYYTGPLDNNGNVSLSTCNQWDRHFSVWSTQINGVISAFVNQGSTGTIPLTSISDSVKYWPGKGNPYLSALGFDVSMVLAPFYDADGDGIYDPAHGDYPTIKQGGISPSSNHGICGNAGYDSISYIHNSAFANQMVFWVMNDIGNVHNGSSGGQAIGIQVNELAFAFQSNDAINDMTFYQYHIINKSGAVLNQTYLSQFTDPDLGCPNNDKVGCDTSRNLAFVYNGNTINSNNTPGYNYICDQGTSCYQGIVGYGCNLPMLGIEIVEGPIDTLIDPITNRPRQLGMTDFSRFSNDTSGGGGRTPGYYRNYQLSLQENGMHLMYNNQPINYEFPGDPSIATEWSECNSLHYGGDRIMVQTAGPFTFMPCASQFMTIAVIFVQPVTSNCPSLSIIDTAADKAQTLFNSGFRMRGPTALNNIDGNCIRIYPNPVSSSLFFDNGNGKRIDLVEVYDMVGNIVFSQKGTIKSIDMSSLSDGVYFVKTKEGNKESVLKVVKD